MDTHESESSVKKVLKTVVPHKISVEHTTDDETLLDLHVGNPLRRIQQLLEEIKKQKAFSFTLKGSLGIAGIALVITTFGIFGGTKAFCSKGVQSHIGTLKELAMTESPERSYLVERAMVMWYAVTGKDFDRHDRKIMALIQNDNTILHVKERVDGLDLSSFSSEVIVTGQYDSCAQTLTVTDFNGVETMR